VGEDVWLVRGQPRQLRDRERRDRHRAARLRPALDAHALDHRRRLACGLRVVPQLRRPEDRACRVEHDHPVLLAGDRHRGHVPDARLLHRGRERVPPGGRVLLAPRRLHVRVRCPPARDEVAVVRVADLDLRRLR
jgi:hypothetical protein